ALVFPSPAAASVTIQLVQLVSVAESHGLKKAVQRFLLICFLGFKNANFWRFLLILILLATTSFLKSSLIRLIFLVILVFCFIIFLLYYFNIKKQCYIFYFFFSSF